MQIEFEIISSGYRHARVIGFHHLFAQWPVNRQPEMDNISHNGVSQRTLDEFLNALRDHHESVTYSEP